MALKLFSLNPAFADLFGEKIQSVVSKLFRIDEDYTFIRNQSSRIKSAFFARHLTRENHSKKRKIDSQQEDR